LLAILGKASRYQSEWSLTAYDASVLLQERERSVYFEEVVAAGIEPKQACHWIVGEILAGLKKMSCGLADGPITAGRLASLLRLVKDGTISGKIAKDVLEKMWDDAADPSELVERLGLRQVVDRDEVVRQVALVLAAHPEKLAEYRAGRDKLFGFFVGQIMKATGGTLNPSIVNEVLQEQLGNPQA
jgi:aspartyl-tRNA(Asn)/glutamyl-tRNA(Gln) amidotransferase subunit B